jgi:uncharacterized membrane protein YkoI
MRRNLMPRRTRFAVALLAVAVAAAVGTGIAVASSNDDGNETPITGSALRRASDSALEHTGGGTVTGTEVGDEESYYEVEVTREDGSQVDVQLDHDFNVVSGEGDVDATEDGG